MQASQANIEQAFLGIGSNVGERLHYVRDAIFGLSKVPGITLVRFSNVYETEPVGDVVQNEFLNAVVEVNTSLELTVFYNEIKKLERAIGRQPHERWGPREIDIDILLYGVHTVSNKLLTVPHTELHKRNFVLSPLAELAPTVVHPVLHQTIQTLLKTCDDRHAVRCSQELTKQLYTLL